MDIPFLMNVFYRPTALTVLSNRQAIGAYHGWRSGISGVASRHTLHISSSSALAAAFGEREEKDDEKEKEEGEGGGCRFWWWRVQGGIAPSSILAVVDVVKVAREMGSHYILNKYFISNVVTQPIICKDWWFQHSQPFHPLDIIPQMSTLTTLIC